VLYIVLNVGNKLIIILLYNIIKFFIQQKMFETMHVERCIRVFAGSFLMISTALGAKFSPIYVSDYTLLFAAFVGVNLFQFGLSNFCPLKNMLLMVGVKPTCDTCPKWEDIYKAGDQTTAHKIWSVMDITRSIRTVAGTFILISLALGYFVEQYILGFTFFVGANLFQFGISNWCPMEIVLGMLGLRPAGQGTKDVDVAPQPQVEAEMV